MASKLKKKDTTPVKYTDGKDTWEAVPGQPNGAFSLPGGEPGEVYSFSSLFEMIRKHCRRVKVVNQAQEIEDQGEPTMDDAVSFFGSDGSSQSQEKKPEKSVKSKSNEKQDKIRVFLKANPESKKVDISEGTGLSLSMVSAALPLMTDVSFTKSGSTNLYSLKN